MNSELNLTDNTLAARIGSDSKDAFKLLYNRYNRKLYYFSMRYLGDKKDAEDLVQEVFVNIWEHRKSLDATMSVKNYIYRITVNCIFNFLKKKTVRARFVETELQKGELLTNQTYDQVFLHDLERSIISIVETLPPQQQKIFRLSRFEGLSHEEIANNLGLSVRTVENQIYRVLRIIKSKL